MAKLKCKFLFVQKMAIPLQLFWLLLQMYDAKETRSRFFYDQFKLLCCKCDNHKNGRAKESHGKKERIRIPHKKGYSLQIGAFCFALTLSLPRILPAPAALQTIFEIVTHVFCNKGHEWLTWMTFYASNARLFTYGSGFSQLSNENKR